MRSRFSELPCQRCRKASTWRARPGPRPPDAGQWAAGQRQAEHVEQLPGKFEHLRRQRCQLVIEAAQHQRIGGSVPPSTTGISARSSGRSSWRSA